jgi:hypothetical protein
VKDVLELGREASKCLSDGQRVVGVVEASGVPLLAASRQLSACLLQNQLRQLAFVVAQFYIRWVDQHIPLTQQKDKSALGFTSLFDPTKS